MKKPLTAIIIVIIIAGLGAVWKLTQKETPLLVENFEACVKAGNPIMESYPRQCQHGGRTFTEDIGNELEKADFIRINAPRPNQVIQSPLTVTGQARGSWFFEASFPVVLTNWDGLIIAQGIATAKSDWMTSEFVPFEARLTFTVDTNSYNNKGTLILRKDNPSGLPEHDDTLEIPVVIAGTAKHPRICTQDAKQCSDGSYVSRSGPNCEFAPCRALSPIGKQCDSPSDASCPANFECTQSCGPPVVRYPDDTPPKYFCQLKGYIRPCPICLAKDTLIDTPLGAMPVQDMQKGMPVWTVTTTGQRVAGVVVKTSKTPVPLNHKIVKLILSDGRMLFVSPGHPTIDGRIVGELIAGNLYDGVRIVSSAKVSYRDNYTYDILPSGETGFYFANGLPERPESSGQAGILLDSTLHY